MGARGPDRGVKPHPMTKERIDLFLRHYKASGANFAFAAAAACPGGKEGTDKPCYSSFRNLRKRNLGFRAACEEILEQVADEVEAEIDRRGRLGFLTPVYMKGERVYDKNPETGEMEPASIRRYSDALLLARAKSLMPEKYGDSKKIDIHHHKAGGMVLIESSDIKHFSQAQIEALGSIITTIREHREGEAETPAIEYQPAQVLEVPIVEKDAVAVEIVPDVASAPDETEETAEQVFPWE